MESFLHETECKLRLHDDGSRQLRMSSPATYLYCLLRAKAVPSAQGAPPGLPASGAVRLIEVDRDLHLVAGDAPRERYAEEAIRRSMRDLDWVAECALAHESVVEHFLPHGDVLPFQLFTLFDSDRRALEDLAARRPQIDAELARLAGCQEWDVRIFGGTAEPPSGVAEPPSGVAEPPSGVAELPGAAAEPPGSAAAAAPPTPRSGTEYLAAKRERLLGRQQRAASMLALAEAAMGELAGMARDCKRREPSEPAAGGLPLQCAFLLSRAEHGSFRAKVDALAARLARQGLGMKLTGPWPPYHFVARSP